MKDNFTAHGYDVRTASEGSAAYEMALAKPPDLMLLDIMFPNLNGYEICRRLRDRGQAVIVVSHNIPNVFEVADRIFVLRLGQRAGDFEAADVSQEQVVAAITGAEIGSLR